MSWCRLAERKQREKRLSLVYLKSKEWEGQEVWRTNSSFS